MHHLQSDKDFKSFKGTTFVEIYTKGCLGCTMLKKLIERDEAKYPDISFCDLNIDRLNTPLPPDIKSLPAVIVMKDSEIIKVTSIDHKKINKSFDELVLAYS